MTTKLKVVADQSIALVKAHKKKSITLAGVTGAVLLVVGAVMLPGMPASSPAPSGTPHLPWQSGTSMQYGPSGVHEAGYDPIWGTGGWKAVDLLSDGSTGHAPNSVKAVTGGTIDGVCDDGTTVAVKMGGFIYAHLLKNDRLVIGHSFSQGDELGQLKTGTFGTKGKGCGYADQSPGWFHLHLGFPNTDSIVFGDWTLNLSEEVWRRGNETRKVNQWIP